MIAWLKSLFRRKPTVASLTPMQRIYWIMLNEHHGEDR